MLRRLFHLNRIAAPFETGLSNTKKIRTRRNTREIDVRLDNDCVVLQLRDSRCGPDLFATTTEQRYFVASFFAPDRQVQNQLSFSPREFQLRLTYLRLVLSASARTLPNINF